MFLDSFKVFIWVCLTFEIREVDQLHTQLKNIIEWVEKMRFWSSHINDFIEWIVNESEDTDE